jgi:hypothetical protein
MALVLIVTPVLFYWLREREIRQVERQGVAERRALETRPAGGPAD